MPATILAPIMLVATVDPRLAEPLRLLAEVGATAEDDRIALTPEGAAYVAEHCQPTEAVTPTAYENLYLTCRVQGCQDDPEPRTLDCYRHQFVDAF